MSHHADEARHRRRARAVLSSRWIPVLLIAAALTAAWRLWGEALAASRPVTTPLSPIERRFGPVYDRGVVKSLQRPVPNDLHFRGTFAEATDWFGGVPG